MTYIDRCGHQRSRPALLDLKSQVLGGCRRQTCHRAASLADGWQVRRVPVSFLYVKAIKKACEMLDVCWMWLLCSEAFWPQPQGEQRCDPPETAGNGGAMPARFVDMNEQYPHCSGCKHEPRAVR